MTEPQKDDLRAQVLALPQVCAMPHAVQEILIEELVYRIPYGIVVYDIVSRGKPRKPGTPRVRGPRHKQHVMTLLVDCAEALEVATGEAEPLWEMSGSGREALACTIARIAIQIALGKRSPYVGQLHRQIEVANRALATR